MELPNQIKEIRQRVVKSDESGIFHNSRQDVRTLTTMVNILIDKVNELTRAYNNLKALQGEKE